MDKYLIKKPKSSTRADFCVGQTTRMKQSTLESLGGVVIMDDIIRCKRTLNSKSQLPEKVLSCLEYLQTKNPSKEILKTTGIGKIVHRLTRHSDENISKLAKIIYDKWVKMVKKTGKPLIEVRCDRKTEEYRRKAVELMRKSIVDEHSKLVEVIERKIYYSSNKLINDKYKKYTRKAVFALKNEEIRNKITQKAISVENFINSYCMLESR